MSNLFEAIDFVETPQYEQIMTDISINRFNIVEQRSANDEIKNRRGFWLKTR